jgi:hypothetical protein
MLFTRSYSHGKDVLEYLVFIVTNYKVWIVSAATEHNGLGHSKPRPVLIVLFCNKLDYYFGLSGPVMGTNSD